MMIYSDGEDLRLGDMVRLVRKSDKGPANGFWSTFHEITRLNNFEVCVDGANRPYEGVFRNREALGYTLHWEIKPRTIDYKADQESEDEDLL